MRALAEPFHEEGAIAQLGEVVVIRGIEELVLDALAFLELRIAHTPDIFRNGVAHR